jgi:hypothetical protein
MNEPFESLHAAYHGGWLAAIKAMSEAFSQANLAQLLEADACFTCVRELVGDEDWREWLKRAGHLMAQDKMPDIKGEGA